MSDPWADNWEHAAANSLACWDLAIAELRRRFVFRDENGAGYATLAKDPDSGLEYLIDVRTKERVYRLATCACGTTPWSSVPSTETTCVFCRLGVGKVAQNDA